MSTIPDEVRAAGDKTLVTTFAALTHVMHYCDPDQIVRLQRDQVEAEILRRMASC